MVEEKEIIQIVDEWTKDRVVKLDSILMNMDCLDQIDAKHPRNNSYCLYHNSKDDKHLVPGEQFDRASMRWALSLIGFSIYDDLREVGHEQAAKDVMKVHGR